MASITICGLDDAVEEKLRERAARHCPSMEEEARKILETGLADREPEKNLLEALRDAVEPFGGFELPEFPGRKDLPREPPSFE
jgi:plasmid stability protein